MENLSVDIAAYLKATVFNWFFLGPGLVMVVLELLDKVGGWKVPGKTYIHLVFTACLVAAMFLTWRDVYHDNQRLSGELETVRKELDKPIVKDDGSQALITDLRLKLADSERRNDKAENTIGNMQAKTEKLRSELEQTQGQLRAAIAKQDDKNSKAVIRTQLGGFLGIGNAIWKQCGRHDNQDACLSNDWVNQVKTFLLDKFDSSYVERFEHPKIEAGLGYDGSEVRSRSLVKLRGQIEFLKEVLKELS